MRSLNQETQPGTSGIHANLWSQVFVDTEAESGFIRAMLGSVTGSDLIPDTNGLGPCLNQIYRYVYLLDPSAADNFFAVRICI